MNIKTRGIHTRPNNGATNDWCTPQYITDALGTFDLDPCRCYGQVQTHAKDSFTVDDDGLARQWHGRVWLNPPYGQQIREWLRRLANHGNGIALVPSRTEVDSWFWPFIWARATGIFFFRGRLYFERPDGTRLGNAGHGSVLAAYGKSNVIAISRSTLPGKMVYLGHGEQ